MEHEVALRTARLTIRSVELVNQSLREIGRLAQAIETATETINSSLDLIEESKKAMAKAARVRWWC